ncbi:MAG: phage head-tail adapter protein [Lachnospiraceae bacterium]|jgi:sugar lactone lactonase YvrE|nr:phage head-tail adapter protein [Lachnospiraceae bacterium]
MKYESKLFAVLPEYISTPDSMSIDKEGNLILSCPNFADGQKSCIVKFDKDRNITKWFDVPVHPETGVARSMGIDFDADWNLYICDNQGWSQEPDVAFKGRILKIIFNEDGSVKDWKTVATGMEHPNGIKIKGDYMYLTQSLLSKVEDPSGKLVSCVYRFGLNEENIQITNTLEDKHIFATFLTHNPDDQYGVDGIAFDSKGDLYIGNFGDGEVYKLTFNEDGSLKENVPWAKNPKELRSTDGMVFDKDDNLYIADFVVNAIGKITPEKVVERIAQSPDCDGLDGGLDQPGEPIIWNGMIVAACFDCVTGGDKVNTAHEMPATLACFEL